MPPKKSDPQAQKRQFEDYKQTPEFKKIQETYQLMKSLPRISQTSRDYDLDGKYQIIWDSLYQLAQIMKVKPPFKKIEHQWIRSIYFGEKRKSDPKDQKCIVDGILCQYQPTEADSQYNLRQSLIKKIYNMVIDLDMNFDQDNYTKSRQQIKKGFQQFFKDMKNHLKKPFKIVYEEKLMEVLQPFSDLLEINMKLSVHQLKYSTPQERFVNNFKYKAIVDRYCVCLDKILDILSTFHNKPVKFKINPKNIFKKLDYQNLAPIEQTYLNPYREAFETMSQGLCALFSTGINFWKVPIQQNKTFVQDLCNLINWELICQRFFGNDLVRDQMKYGAQFLSGIVKANQLAQRYFLKQDANAMEISVPRLIAFKTIQHMRDYKDKVFQIQEKQKQKSKVLGATIMSNHEEEEEGSIQNNSNLVQTKQTFKSGDIKTKTIKIQSLIKPQHEQAREKLGRYWIWENYCDEKFKETTIQEAVQMLQHVNKAVQQDIQDAIIRDGMLPRRDRQNQELKDAAESLKHMKTMDNAQRSQNMQRPPQLWNFPKVIEEQHRFRTIADPKKCYVDGRIQKLDEMINKIGEHIRTFNQPDWIQLIRRIIDFYKKKPDPNPFKAVPEAQQQTQQAAS